MEIFLEYVEVDRIVNLLRLCFLCTNVREAVTLSKQTFLLYFFLGGVCFSNPTSPPRSPIGSVPCVPSYTLSSPAFKGVTHGMSFKHSSPPLCYPWYMQVWLGAWSKSIIWETWVQFPQSGVPRVLFYFDPIFLV